MISSINLFYPTKEQLSTMPLFSRQKDSLKDSPKDTAPSEPPPYSEVDQNAGENSQAPSYAGKYGPNEYPPEKPHKYEHSDGATHSNATYTIPANDMYEVKPQQVNIAYETDGKHTRPGFKEYLESDHERVSLGNGPLPREAFGKKGAPLEPGRKNNKSAGGSTFPGSGGTTYFNAANR